MTTKTNIQTFYKHPVAELYALATLDFIIELAITVSRDFYQRSRHYKKVPEHIADTILDFRSYLGSHPDWPSVIQRSSVYKILSEGNQLCAVSVRYRLATLAIPEDSSSPDYDLRIKSFYEAAKNFREYINKQEGQAIVTGVKKIRGIFNAALEILTNKEVTQVFGISELPKDGWPFNGITDIHGANLLDTINTTITPKTKDKISKDFIYAKQRIAHFGALSMIGILSDSEQLEVSKLIKYNSNWVRGLRDLVPHVVRYWKSPEKISELNEIEKSQLPENPAGSIDLQGVNTPTADTGQTCTGGAYCCCDTLNYCDTDIDDCFVNEQTTEHYDTEHVNDFCDA